MENSKKMLTCSVYGGSSRMLCFGGENHGLFTLTPAVRNETTSSSSSSSSNNNFSKSDKAVLGRRKTVAGTVNNGAQKRARKKEQQNPKVRNEKIGERIMALQQLVSPFGKSDTASVLHEVLGYIKFLHEQVKVLSSPYLQQLPSSSSARVMNLRSRGLCLVPVESTAHTASSNGADIWSPVMGSNACDGDPNP
ncbi:hypothetical protein ZOSMA_125G00660 [Zostera marina]|uniref:BHLH domain-containing protein n=1 Tax=Zostera marina TaxID=29655 RepID=A0A0K9Q2A1_ZOSMR|nr:hypothetical protein ZOSMA_125G00660 [Zostera marina]